MTSRRHSPLLVQGILWLLAPAGIYSQAFTPPKGAGNFFQAGSYTFGRAHIVNSGDAFSLGKTNSIDANFGFAYGITNRLAVRASVPFVQSQFVKPPGAPLSPHDQLSDVDDGAWYGGFQDYRLAASYNAVRGPVSITPFFEFSAPTRNYKTFGHSIPGRGLREYRFGFNAGGLLSPINERVFGDIGYSYTHAQKLEGIRPSRSNIDAEIGYFLSRTIALFASGAWQQSHGGVEFPLIHFERLFLFHDQLARAHFTHTGGGISLSLNPMVDLYASVTTTLSGKNIDRTTTVTVGTSYNFTRLRLPLFSLYSRSGRKARAAALTARGNN